jgi:hypothetical protein
MYCYWSCADLEINFLHACRQHGTPRNNMPKKSHQQFPKWNYDLLINDWNNIFCKTKHHHVNASCTIEKQLAFWIVFCSKFYGNPYANASFSWIVKVLVWRRISAAFPVPNPLWTHVAWEYQNTGLGACLNPGCSNIITPCNQGCPNIREE